jgi:carbon storage regulator
MLVLSRRVGQQIRIGDSIVVTLLKVDRNKARIGVDAPPSVPVYRQELFDFDRSRQSRLANPAANSEPKNLAMPRSNFGRVAEPRLLWESAPM